jgi:signal peptidase
VKLKPKHRRILIDISAILVIILTVLGIYFGFRVALATTTPWLAVGSGSMSPTLEVGDLVIVQGAPASEIKEGEIIVFNAPGEDGYTIHRVISKEPLANGTFRFRTKGDANPDEDLDWVPEQNVQGRVLYRIPYIGWLEIDPAIPIILIAVIAVIIILWPESRRKRRKI